MTPAEYRSSPPEPVAGAERPGGRTARNTAAVLQATLSELGERGYGDLTVERIAVRSGVHKTTIYRRWGGTEELLAAALVRSTRDDWRPPETGSLHTDLVALGREVVHGLVDSELSSVSSAVIAAAFESQRAAAAVRDFFTDRHERSAAVVETAIHRGEVPAGTDTHEVVRAAVAPLYYRLFVSREPVTEVEIRRAGRVAAEAATAGSFVPAHEEGPDD